MADMAMAKRAGLRMMAPIDPAELAVRMCEANYRLKRPAGHTAVQALEAMEEDCRDGWRRSAEAAMEYWIECINNAQPVN